MEHPDLTAEQGYLDRSYTCLDRGLADAERSMSEYTAVHRSTAQAIQRALRILKDSKGTGQLIFGRIRSEGQDLYVGRRRVYDENRDLLVASWHAPAARVFYEASPSDPRGLDLKRQFSERERRLVGIIDEIVAAAAAEATDTTGEGVAFSDALLAELDRSRDGAMRDVVATIQSEQFGIIRAGLDRVVVVEGGPGTGKTVVGLHRAAWLAFNHEELRRNGVLVVAPSTNFLTYVSGVLPSLDVTDVEQVEIQRLYAGEAGGRAPEESESARVKGSEVMAEVLQTALTQRTGWSGGDLVLSLGGDRITVPGQAITEIVDDVRGRALSHLDARDVFRDRLARVAADLHREEQRAAGRPVRANESIIRRLSAFTNAVDRAWPAFTPEELLRSLYSTQAWLVAATEGLVTGDQRARLFRPAAERIEDEPWTEADVICLDELNGLLTGEVVTYGHLVVDEAQDLSPMQARALARRCPSGSFTLLGDLAQAAGVWVRDGWDELTRHISEGPAEVHSLTIGYRVPGPVLDLAAKQLPMAGPDLRPPLSIRTGAGEPSILCVLPEDLEDAVVARAREYVDAGRTTAVIVADDQFDQWLEVMRRAPAGSGDGRDGDFSAAITVVPGTDCKGLEFDAVVLVEPEALASRSLHPPRSLYVAMTRCTQALTLVHSRPLPPGISPEPSPISEHLLLNEATTEGTQDQGPGAGSHPATPVEVTDTRREVGRLLEQLDDHDVDLVRQLVRRLSGTQEGQDDD